MRLPVDLSGMALFVKIVEAGSISAASRSLTMPKSSLSRQLSLMEQRLGVALLTRSTRAITLTDFGRQYYERVRPIVVDAEHAQIEAESYHAEPSGMLRISMPRNYGELVVAPKLFAFSSKYPAVRLNLHVSDERVNVISDGYDLVIRAGAIEDSELICRKLEDAAMVVVASPAYLERVGTPRTIEELAGHRAIVTRGDINHLNLQGKSIRLAWTMSTGDMNITCAAIRAGLGIALVPLAPVEQDIRRGDLVQLLPEIELPSAPVTLLYARTKTPSPALIALIKHLLDQEE